MLHARSDVNAVAEHIGAAVLDIAEVNADADFKALGLRRSAVAGRMLLLDRNGAVQRRQRTVERDQNRVPNGLDLAAAVAADHGSHQPKVLIQQSQRLRFVDSRQRAIAHHVSEHHRRQAAALLSQGYSHAQVG